MTLRKLLEIMGMGTFLHIGTKHGRGWCYSDTVKNLTDYLPDDWKNREVVHMYLHEGRTPTSSCCALKSGIAVIIKGYEYGNI